VLEIDVVNGDSEDRVHANQKPEELAAWFIKTYTKPGGLVLDPTAGSGSTLLAAMSLGRRFVGFETDGEMCDQARRRIDERRRRTA
jgi:site-specific DNA-methyltransferase (adenine-specific)